LKLSPHVANTSHSADVVLAHCTAGVAACWELSVSTELSLALDTVSAYIPTLVHTVRTVSSERQRQEVAHLLVESLLLKTRLVRDLQSSHASILYAQQAQQYSEVAADPVSRHLHCERWHVRSTLQTSGSSPQPP